VFSLHGSQGGFLTPGSSAIELSRIRGQEYVVSVFAIRNPPTTSAAKYVACDFEATAVLSGPLVLARNSNGELRSTLSQDFSTLEVTEDRVGCGGFGGDLTGRYTRIGALPSGFVMPTAGVSGASAAPPSASREQSVAQAPPAVNPAARASIEGTWNCVERNLHTGWTGRSSETFRGDSTFTTTGEGIEVRGTYSLASGRLEFSVTEVSAPQGGFLRPRGLGSFGAVRRLSQDRLEYETTNKISGTRREHVCSRT
jgi:hypothetical protein